MPSSLSSSLSPPRPTRRSVSIPSNNIFRSTTTTTASSPGPTLAGGASGVDMVVGVGPTPGSGAGPTLNQSPVPNNRHHIQQHQQQQQQQQQQQGGHPQSQSQSEHKKQQKSNDNNADDVFASLLSSSWTSPKPTTTKPTKPKVMSESCRSKSASCPSSSSSSTSQSPNPSLLIPASHHQQQRQQQQPQKSQQQQQQQFLNSKPSHSFSPSRLSSSHHHQSNHTTTTTTTITQQHALLPPLHPNKLQIHNHQHQNHHNRHHHHNHHHNQLQNPSCYNPFDDILSLNNSNSSSSNSNTTSFPTNHQQTNRTNNNQANHHTITQTITTTQTSNIETTTTNNNNSNATNNSTSNPSSGSSSGSGSSSLHNLANSFMEKVEDYFTTATTSMIVLPEMIADHPCSSSSSTLQCTPFGGDYYTPNYLVEDGVLVCDDDDGNDNGGNGGNSNGNGGDGDDITAHGVNNDGGDGVKNAVLGGGHGNDVVIDGHNGGDDDDDDDDGEDNIINLVQHNTGNNDDDAVNDGNNAATTNTKNDELQGDNGEHEEDEDDDDEGILNVLPGGHKQRLQIMEIQQQQQQHLQLETLQQQESQTCYTIQQQQQCDQEHQESSSHRDGALSPILQILPPKYHDEWNAVSTPPLFWGKKQLEKSPSFPDLGLDGLNDTDHWDNTVGGNNRRRHHSISASAEGTFAGIACANDGGGSSQEGLTRRSRANTLEHPMPYSHSNQANHQNSVNMASNNRNRATTIESVMAVISLSSTVKSVSSAMKGGNSSGSEGLQKNDHGYKDDGMKIVVHGAKSGGMETSMAHLNGDFQATWHDTDEIREGVPTWDPSSRGGRYHHQLEDHTPMKEVYPIPPLCRTSSDGEYDDASAVSSLSDDERYGLHDEGDDGIVARMHYKKPTSDRGSTEAVGSGGATTGGGVRAMAALLKKPRELANKMSAGGAAIVRQSSTARDTVTTAATTTAHTLETINTPKSVALRGNYGPMGEDEFLSRWRSMGQNNENSSGLDSSYASPGGYNSSNSTGGESFVSQQGYHRRCRNGMTGFNSMQGYYRRTASAGNRAIGASMPLSPGDKLPIPSPGAGFGMGSNYLIPLPSPIPLSPKLKPNEFQGIPSPIVLHTTCENSVVSGASSVGWTVKSGEPQTSSTSYDGRSMVRSSSLSSAFQRPPMANRSKSIQDAFDPLAEVNSEFEDLSTGTPSSNPPRYLKDDPLLSKSRYRGRLIASQSIRKPAKATKKPKPKPVLERESTCMIGTIALSETNPLSPRRHSGVLRKSITSLDCISPQGTFDSLNSPQDASTTPKSHASLSLSNECDEDDEASCEFAEEFHRQDKSSVVKEELKHFIGKLKKKPVVKVGRKLLGRESPSNNLKRADGCLT